MNQPTNQVNVNLQECKTLKCECGSYLWDQVYISKVLPGILLGQAKDQVSLVPVLKCNKCGTLDPSQLGKILQKDDLPRGKPFVSSGL